MGRIRQTRRIRYTFRKSKMVKDAAGMYHCPTCGAFKGRDTSKNATSDKKKKS